MRFKWRILTLLAVVSIVATGVWLRFNWVQLERQWRVYRVGAATSYEKARRELAWLDREPDRAIRLRELVRKWGTGNPQFDLHLARYVGDPASSEALREAFSLNLAWRDGLLERWAHYWSWRPGESPRERVESIRNYLDLLLASNAKGLTWREVLDLQAVFHLTGQPRLALRLAPENWRDRYRQWLAKRPEPLPLMARPDQPFPDWSRNSPPRNSAGRDNPPWQFRPAAFGGMKLRIGSGTDTAGIACKEVTWTTKRIVRIRDRSGRRPGVDRLHPSATGAAAVSAGETRIAALASFRGLGTSAAKPAHPVMAAAGDGQQDQPGQQAEKRAFHRERFLSPGGGSVTAA